MKKNTGHYNFNQLSIADLLEARDTFHETLMNLKNVVATAIGRYRIRVSDLDEHGRYKPAKKKTKRTLANSIVCPISWPCVLVFVEEWQDNTELAATADLVPLHLDLRGGRQIPVCIIEAPGATAVSDEIQESRLSFPTNLMGGGFPVTVHSQNDDHIASAGCIVSDGHTYYLLTNKHVAGGPGQEIKSIIGDEPVTIGYSNDQSLGKIEFERLYTGWAGKNVKVNCDAGLVELEDVKRWKTDVLGVAQMGPLFDLNTLSLNLGLIAEHEVVDGKIQDSLNGNLSAFGAVSASMKGEIAALFYRYQALGGYEYVSDLLISGRNNVMLNTHYGDSGTVWFLETTGTEGSTYNPIALHWGQHQVIDGTGKQQFPYALATNLTNICRELDVQLVRGWNMDEEYSWGKVGHYTVGSLAVSTVTDPKLKQLLQANLKNISFDKANITKDLDGKDNPLLGKDPSKGFCPLSDVPDIIWKQAKLSADGKSGYKWGRKGDENPNHYADADKKTPQGKTLYDYCPNPAALTVENWIDYFDTLDKAAGVDITKVGATSHRGLICFRVWQIFDYMVAAIKANDPTKLIFSAGVLAHYIGDGCQPLHSSYMSDGNPDLATTIQYTAKVTSKKKNGEISHMKGDVYSKQIIPGAGVHVAYEDHMIDDYIDRIMPLLPARITSQNAANNEKINDIKNGQDAAFAVLTLMRKCQETLPPKSIVDAFIVAKGTQNISKTLYDAFGDQTVTVLARGSRVLATVWEAAWSVAGKKITKLGEIEQPPLQKLYADPNQLKSYLLSTIKPILK